MWSDTDYLIAQVVDAVRGGNWQRGGGKGPRPKPVPRPGKDDHTKKVGKAVPLNPKSREFFDRWRNGELKATEVERTQVHHRKGVTRHGR